MPTITPEQYEAICAVIDRVKMDERQEDTDAYATEIATALGLAFDTEGR